MVATKAAKPFWLDGGYDRTSVEACPYHPRHYWQVFRVKDIMSSREDSSEWIVLCKGCYAVRCDGADEPDPCIYPRHHTEPHLTQKRHSWPVGGSPRVENR
jgi:hypothetical protein